MVEFRARGMDRHLLPSGASFVGQHQQLVDDEEAARRRPSVSDEIALFAQTPASRDVGGMDQFESRMLYARQMRALAAAATPPRTMAAAAPPAPAGAAAAAAVRPPEPSPALLPANEVPPGKVFASVQGAICCEFDTYVFIEEALAHFFLPFSIPLYVARHGWVAAANEMFVPRSGFASWGALHWLGPSSFHLLFWAVNLWMLAVIQPQFFSCAGYNKPLVNQSHIQSFNGTHSYCNIVLKTFEGNSLAAHTFDVFILMVGSRAQRR